MDFAYSFFCLFVFCFLLCVFTEMDLNSKNFRAVKIHFLESAQFEIVPLKEDT